MPNRIKETIEESIEEWRNTRNLSKVEILENGDQIHDISWKENHDENLLISSQHKLLTVLEEELEGMKKTENLTIRRQHYNQALSDVIAKIKKARE